ncbi:type IV pilus assembly protein PilM [Vibrio xiamenensis]|uniref:Type IV pilus assembly protein PilM n=1 Tax=Vibrio xiamenensis TaxID=861298 RepID=A0A1G8BK19_9VIBR|nr:type IV pilus assembly protein PilM [Vibrio xiamenensis]SDH33572.1 type IV pilus assembly protein PilM [Vibrio xiamenensis]
MGRSMITGIDLGHRAIRAVTLKPNGNHFLLMDYRELPVEAGIFSDNPKQNYQEIVKKLKELRKGLPLFSRRVSLAVPDNSVINKLIQVDSQLIAPDLEFAIAHALSQQSTLAMDEVEFDYVPVCEPSPLSDHASYQVYATKSDLIENLQTWLRGAGFQPVMLDTKARSLVQLWQLQASIYQRCDYLLLNLEPHQAQLAIDFFDAAPFMRSFAWREHSLVEELKRTIERLLAQHDCSISGVWLCGEAADSETLSLTLSDKLQLPCIQVALTDLVKQEKALQSSLCLSGAYGLATGLALRAFSWLGRDDAGQH